MVRTQFRGAGTGEQNGRSSLQIYENLLLFRHIVFGTDARIVATAQTTANMLIEVNHTALASGGHRKHLKVSALTDLQKVKLATGIARTAALDYLKSECEFSNFPFATQFNATPPAMHRLSEFVNRLAS